MKWREMIIWEEEKGSDEVTAGLGLSEEIIPSHSCVRLSAEEISNLSWEAWALSEKMKLY